MAGSFLSKLRGQLPKTGADVLEALESLGRLASERASLNAAARFMKDVLPGLFAKPVESVAFSISPEAAREKWVAGEAILSGAELPIDEAEFSRRWKLVCAHLPDAQDRDALANALRHSSFSSAEMIRAVLASRPDAAYAKADELGLEAGQFATVLRLALLPVLTELGERLTALRNVYRWERGYCPTCGSWPLLGEFRGLEQTRILRCGLCASGWEYPRLRCLFCGTTDHRQLGYFYIEGEEPKYRASTCASCRGYVKMVSTLTELSAPMLLVEDLATVHLDLAAAERGLETPMALRNLG